MTIYEKNKNMLWKLDKIRFLHPPDDFLGTFQNDKMQARHKAMQDKKIKEIFTQLENTNDPIKAMRILHSREHIQFLLNNLELFKENDCLEEAVLLLYFRKNTPFVTFGEYDVWKFLLKSCDADRLYNLGAPLPSTKVTGYRGSVTGIATGLSYTISRKKVAWILNSWQDKELGGGTVFSLEITRKDIMVYIEDDVRQEVILIPEVAETAEGQIITTL